MRERSFGYSLPKQVNSIDAGTVVSSSLYDKLYKYTYSEDDLSRLVDDIGEEGVLLLCGLAYFQKVVFSVFEEKRMLTGVDYDGCEFYLSNEERSVAVLIDRVVNGRVQSIGKDDQMKWMKFDIDRWITFIAKLDHNDQKIILGKFLSMRENYPFVKVFFQHVPECLIGYIKKDLRIDLDDVLDQS